MKNFLSLKLKYFLKQHIILQYLLKLYREWLLDKPLQIQSKIFQTLMNFDIIPNCDSQYLAIKYYLPIYFYANKWLFSEELTEENKIAFREAAYKHIQIFFTEMGENK